MERPIFLQGPTILSPQIPLNKLPPSEHNHARFIERLLHDLGRRCLDFDAAVKLLDYCVDFLKTASIYERQSEENQSRWLWRGFAAREAAATIYRSSEAMECIGENLGKCPVLQKIIDHESKRAALKLFKESFPGHSGIRHGSQHYAKLYGSPEQFARHAADEVNFVNHIEGRVVTTIFKKKHVSLEISEEASAKLKQVRDLYWVAYMSAADR